VSASAKQDEARLGSVLARRREKSRRFFATAADQWDALRIEVFGDQTDVLALLDLLDESWAVGDLGCGTGRLTEILAPSVGRVIGVDASDAMLMTARHRLAGADNVEFRTGDLEALPISDGTLDAALLSLVLHHAPEPTRVLAEAHRTLRPGGRLLLVDMLPHERVEYRQQMGHVWLGFSEEQVRSRARDAGFAKVRFRPLGVDAEAKGPPLFVAVARR
jgi:ArsR family transcriptional regulator